MGWVLKWRDFGDMQPAEFKAHKGLSKADMYSTINSLVTRNSKIIQPYVLVEM